jgi:hypothetical protein
MSLPSVGNNNCMAEIIPPRRRWFQFSLRTMLIVVAILAWGLATRPYRIAYEGDYAGPMSGPPWGPIYKVEYRLNPKLLWPVAALVGLVATKGALQLASRRARRHPQSATRL